MLTIQLVTQKGFASAAIRYLTYSDFSHVDLVLPRGSLLGARMDGGVAIRKPDYGAFTSKARFACHPGAAVERKVYEFAHSQVGKPYDHLGICNLFLQRNWKEEDSWFCSELIAAAFEHAEYPLLNVPNSDRVTPRDLTLSPLLKRVA